MKTKSKYDVRCGRYLKYMKSFECVQSDDKCIIQEQML